MQNLRSFQTYVVSTHVRIHMSGGVGQSLYSSLLANTYGPLHTYFDPSIWYLDEELRKQVEQFVGCVLLTGRSVYSVK